MSFLRKISLWIWVAIGYTFLSIFFFSHTQAAYRPVLAGLMLIVWISCLGLKNDNYAFSLNKIFWLFNLVFFGLMPGIQVYMQQFPWFQLFSPETCNKANLVIVCALATWYVVRKAVWLFIKPHYLPKKEVLKEANGISTAIGTTIFVVCSTTIVIVYGIQNLWLRRMMLEAEVSMNGTLQLVFDKVVRGCILYYTLRTAWLYKRSIVSVQKLIAILLLCIVANFPFAIPRYLSATLYGGLLLTLYPVFIRKKNTIAVALLILLISVFPLYGLTRYTPSGIRERLAHPVTIIKETFIYGEYDAYANLCRTIEYVDTHGATNGRQLAGVLLFFVPRSIWQAKPVGSGMTVYLDYTVLGKEFRNIASPFYAEGIINFGLLGCVFFVLIISTLSSIYDRHYWNKQSHFTYIILFYPVAVMMFFFMMRGDLLSSFAFLAGFFVSGLLYHLLLKKLNEKEKAEI